MDKVLVINKNWKIVTDNLSSNLIFHEPRLKHKGTDKEESFIFESQTYHPNVLSALESFLLKQQGDAKDVQDCVRITKESLEIIKNLKL